MNLLFALNLYAADSTIVSFSIGNIHAFGGNQHCFGGRDAPVSYSENILADTVINDRRYFVFLRSQNLPWTYYSSDTGVISYRRTDSTSVYRYNVSTMREDTIVNFKDTIGTVYSYGYPISRKDSLPVFGKFYSTIKIGGDAITYASKFFLVHYWADDGLCQEEITLKGAIIDGAYYGDSTLVSVNTQLNNKIIPLDYFLYQNYPNPFNPMTQIVFDNPNKGYVTLNVYDILGRKVAVLVDGIMEGGRHIVVFDGSNLSSGIYLCRLQGGSSIKAKKLILLK